MKLLPGCQYHSGDPILEACLLGRGLEDHVMYLNWNKIAFFFFNSQMKQCLYFGCKGPLCFKYQESCKKSKQFINFETYFTLKINKCVEFDAILT